VVAALITRSAIRRWAAAILGGRMPGIEPFLPTQARVVEPQVTPSAILGMHGRSGTMCQALEDRSAYAVESRSSTGLAIRLAPATCPAAQASLMFAWRCLLLSSVLKVGGEAQMPMWMRIAKGVG